jgi:hypothetical protein
VNSLLAKIVLLLVNLWSDSLAPANTPAVIIGKCL